MLLGTWRKENIHALLAGLWIGAATMEKPQKIKNRTINKISLQDNVKETQNTNLKGYMHCYVYYSIIYNSQHRGNLSVHWQINE